MLTGQSLEMSLTHEDSPPPLTQVEGKVESLDSATYLGAFYLFDLFFYILLRSYSFCFLPGRFAYSSYRKRELGIDSNPEK